MPAFNIPEFEFKPPIDDAPNRSFPDEIALDPWVLYHGTSSVAETHIDSHGLRCSEPTFKKSDLESVVEIFDELQWAGRTGASFAVLKPFSLNHDFGHSQTKPVYLAESAYRALTFATRDFAGGEAARALRHSFGELWEFVDNETIRESHLSKLRKEAELLRQYGIEDAMPQTINVVDIKSRLENLESLRHLAQHFLKHHCHGVVYAIKLRTSDTADLQYHSAMGVKCFADISIDRIVGKIRIPIDYANPPFLSVTWAELPCVEGIIKSLQRQ